MSEQRLIIEMAQGIDLHGRDDTKAARRAVEQALQGASLPVFGTLGLERDVMRVVVHIGVPRPEAVDVAVIAALLRRACYSKRPNAAASVATSATLRSLARNSGSGPTIALNALCESSRSRHSAWRRAMALAPSPARYVLKLGCARLCDTCETPPRHIAEISSSRARGSPSADLSAGVSR